MPNVEREIAEAVLRDSGLSVAALGLRFDRLVLRVLGDLRAGAEDIAPQGVTALATITAPIRLGGKTVAVMRREMAALVARGESDYAAEVNGNAVRLRLVRAGSDHRLVGFVHNPGTDPARLLDMAEAWLRR